MACQTVSLKIPALTPSQVSCAGCAERVCAAVRAVPGVQSAECRPEDATLEVCWDPELIGLEAIEHALAESARSAAGGLGHAAYRVMGLD